LNLPDPREGVTVETHTVDGEERRTFDYSRVRRFNGAETRELETLILEAHARGDADALAILQGLYRTRATITSSERGPSGVTRIESSVSPPPRFGHQGPSVELTPADPDDLGEIPRFVEPTSNFRVKLTSAAREQLAAAARQSRDGQEWGGWLLGARARSWEPIVVEKVVGAGPGAERYEHHMVLPHDNGWREMFEGGALEVVGLWHSHINNNLGPSPSDRVRWGQELGDIEARWGSLHVGLIAEVDTAGGTPRLIAYVTHREQTFGRVVCERADVDEL